MFKRFKNNEKGFTLMEIVIVIVILGILALLAIPRLIGFTEQAEIASDKEYAAVIARASELYWASHEKTAPTMTELETAGLVEDDATALQYAAGSVGIAIDNATGISTITITYTAGGSIIFVSSGANSGYTLAGL